MMLRILIPSLAIGVHGLCIAASAQEVDEKLPYGRASLGVIDPAKGSEVILSSDAEPAPDSRIIVHIEANRECEAVVAAFDRKSGALVQGWLPAVVPLRAWQEKGLPAEKPWLWKANLSPFEVIVAFQDKDSPEAAGLREAVAKLNDEDTEPTAARLMARRLREELMKAVATSPSATSTQPGTAPVKIGGTLRAGRQSSWREAARKVQFSESKLGLTLFRYPSK